MIRLRKLLCLYAAAAVLLTNTAVYAEEQATGEEETLEIANTGEVSENSEEAVKEDTAAEETVVSDETEQTVPDAELPAVSENEESEEAAKEGNSTEEAAVSEETDLSVPDDELPAANENENTTEELSDVQEPDTLPVISYQTHLSSYGWTEQYVSGETALEGRIEALRISSDEIDGSILCQAYAEGIGWMSEVQEGMTAGTTGQSRQAEAFKIRIDGNDAQAFDIYYRALITSFGWTDWAANGSPCGTEGYGLALRSIEIRIVKKDSGELTEGKSFYNLSPVSYQAHIGSIGWQKAVRNGSMAGTTGQSRRMEALLISLPDEMRKLGNIQAYAHVQSVGWMNPVSAGEIIGTTGRSKQLEAVRIELTGQLADLYNIYYRVHVANVGWLDYAKNGETAGSTGYGRAIEAIQIILEEKDGLYSTGYTSQGTSSLIYRQIQYMAHVAHEGWKSELKSPAVAGTLGKSHPIEALTITLPSDLTALGNISFEAHIQNIGWLAPVQSGEMAGTTGRSLQMEGVRISLTGELAEIYDIYYRTYVRGLGWLGWTKNGGLAGSEGCSRWIEGIQIDLVNKEYRKYSLGTAYTILRLSDYSTLLSVLNGSLGSGISSFGGGSLSAGLKNSMMNEVRSIQNSGYGIGFVMIDINSGKGVAYNPDQKFYSASSVKGLYIGALTAQNRNAYYNDSGIMREILRTSSDALYHQLYNKYGYTYLRKWCDQTNIERYVGTNMYSNYNAREMAKLWVKMFEFFSSGDYGNEIGSWYQNPNRSPIHEVLGRSYTTRSKAGWIGEPGYNAAVDGGIIYAASGPYIITIISNMPGSLERLYGLVSLLNSAHDGL